MTSRIGMAARTPTVEYPRVGNHLAWGKLPKGDVVEVARGGQQTNGRPSNVGGVAIEGFEKGPIVSVITKLCAWTKGPPRPRQAEEAALVRGDRGDAEVSEVSILINRDLQRAVDSIPVYRGRCGKLHDSSVDCALVAIDTRATITLPHFATLAFIPALGIRARGIHITIVEAKNAFVEIFAGEAVSSVAGNAFAREPAVRVRTHRAI